MFQKLKVSEQSVNDNGERKELGKIDKGKEIIGMGGKDCLLLL